MLRIGYRRALRALKLQPCPRSVCTRARKQRVEPSHTCEAAEYLSANEGEFSQLDRVGTCHTASSSSSGWAEYVMTGSALAALLWLSAGDAQASEGLPPGLMDAFSSWLNLVAELGPLGPILFILTVGVFECIPLFPTQPLSIASGLLFGASWGTLYTLSGVCLASTIAFTLSRTVGKDLAAKVIEEETGGAGSKSSAVSKQIASVKEAIDQGSTFQQFSAILLLRLTPIVPFSASNYVLGLTPVPYPPYLAATVLGMTVWCTVFASIGGAGRRLLTSGISLDDVMARLGSQAGEVTEKIAIAAAVLGAAVAVAVVLKVPPPFPSEKDDARMGSGVPKKRAAAEKVGVGKD